MALAVTFENAHFTTAASCDQQVLEAIAIEIKPGNSRAQLTEASVQERLTIEIVERCLTMNMPDQMAHIAKPWQDGRRLRSRSGLGSPGFLDFVDVVGKRILNEASF